MKYKCIKEMHIQKYDEDGFRAGEYGIVPIGSVWLRNDHVNIIGGEVYLECTEGAEELVWIEITAESLESHFEAVN